MSIELLEHITEAEHKAVEIRKKSLEEANEILSDAREEGMRLIQQAIAEAESHKEIIMKEAKASIDLQNEKRQEQVMREISRIQKNAAGMSDKAAQAIVERIVNMYVCR